MEGKHRAWDVGQGAIVGSVVLAGVRGRRWPRPLRLPLRVAALAAAIPGAYLFGAGMSTLALDKQLTSAPEPLADATLKRDGAFGLVRHPMYGGVTLLMLAWTLATSPAALLPLTSGEVFLAYKVRREEEAMRTQFPDYDDYARDVPKRFIPYVL